MPSEKEYLQRLDEVMKKKKLEIKEIQADIMKEQTQYKQDYNLFKASFENNPSNQK